MQQAHNQTKAADTSPSAGTLDYAPHSLRPRHSFYSLLSLLMTAVALFWLGDLDVALGHGPPHYLRYDPVWCMFYENYGLPGEIGIGLAVLGILQTGRKRTLSYVAICIIVVAYLTLTPPSNFA